MFETPPMETLSRHVNTKFRLYAEPSRAVEVELVEVKSYGEEVDGMERFSAYFRGPLEVFLPQSTYRMEHDGAGTFDIFIVPIRRGEEGFYYEAVVNRRRVG